MKYLIFLFTSFLLAACGGGGSDDDQKTSSGSVEPTVTVQRVSLSGLAVKGLAKGAQVDAHILVGTSFQATSSATAITNTDGEYKIRLPENLADYEGPVKIVMSFRSGAELQCDDNDGCGIGINEGDFYPMPAEFTLSSVGNIGDGLLNLDGDTVVNLTALTTLATALAEDDSVTAASVDASNNQIRAVFSLPSSVDLTATAPANVVDDETTGDDIYGAINAAFLKIANDDDVSLNDVITSYADAIVENDGQMVLKEESDGDPSLLAVTTAAIELGTLGGAELTKVTAAQTTADAAAAGAVTNINPPSIDAGADQAVDSGVTVNIVANTVIGNPDTYQWQVLSGPLDLTGNLTAITNTLTFVAPEQGGEIALRVIAEDAANSAGADNDIVIITVNPALATDTSASGSYLLFTYANKLFGQGSTLISGLGISRQELNIDMSADGTGNFVLPLGHNRIGYDVESSLNAPSSLELNNIRESENDNSTSSESLPITQLATGTLDFQRAERVEEEGADVYVGAAYNLTFHKYAEGMYTSLLVSSEAHYPLVNNVIDTANIIDTLLEWEQVSLSRAHALNSFAPLANKEYVGMIYRHLVGSINGGEYRFEVEKRRLSFNADASTFTSTGLGGKELIGLPNKNFTTGDPAFLLEDITPSIGEVGNTSIFTMANGTFTIGQPTPAGAIFFHNVAEDLSAISVTGMSYENQSGTDYFDADPTEHVTEAEMLIEKPAAPIDMDGRTLQLTVIENKVINPDNTSALIAPEFIITQIDGTLSFSGAEATWSYTEKESIFLSESGDVMAGDYRLQHNRVVQEGSKTITFSGSTTDADGCIIDTSGPESSFEICMSDNGGVIGRNFYTTTNVGPNSQADEMAIWYILGQEI